MSATTPHDYSMSLSLNVLNHLGINLYTNLPAVLSEAVANAWDADATRVEITIDPESDLVVIEDNGVGMTKHELNTRYLKVGYQRRTDKDNVSGSVTGRGREVMGRKGIGKLSLFSVAKTIEVHSATRRPLDDPSAEVQRNGLVMDLDDIKSTIGTDEEPRDYHPDPVDVSKITIDRGTRIEMTRPRRGLSKAAAHLRRRLARRFSMLPDDFEIVVNDQVITAADRDLAKRCRYVWVFGSKTWIDEFKASVPGAERVVEVAGDTPGGREISGWIGSAKTSTDLKPEDAHDETMNRIAVLVRGKLAQEDALEAVADGGIFTKFLSGEIHANFLDSDLEDDIATSSRQGIVEDDPRFEDFKAFLSKLTKRIGTDWNNFREQDGVKDAAELVPSIKDWIGKFSGDTRSAARSFIGKVNSAAVEPATRKQLLVNGVVAFERLYRAERLSEIEATDEANIPALIDAFKSIDDVESSMYYDIAKQRVSIIRKLQELTEQNVLESTLAQFIFEHLWLLDPGWDKATVPVMEKSVAKIIDDKTKAKDLKDRVDIKYRTTGTTHVIVELKKADRRVTTHELIDQVRRYRTPVQEYLRSVDDAPVEVRVICILGQEPRDWSNSTDRDSGMQSLSVYGTKVVLYDQLIKNSLQSYSDYLEANVKVGEIRSLVATMESEFAAPAGDAVVQPVVAPSDSPHEK